MQGSKTNRVNIFNHLKPTFMKALSLEQMEDINGGCSFDEMMFYATAQLYHLGQLSSGSQYYAYHVAGVGYYTARLMACM